MDIPVRDARLNHAELRGTDTRVSPREKLSLRSLAKNPLPVSPVARRGYAF